MSKSTKMIFLDVALVACSLCFSTSLGYGQDNESAEYGRWMNKPQNEWPQITMINQIEYTDKKHPVAGCGFLLDSGEEILAATAKHILIFFKSDSMRSVSFNNTLKYWRMSPKNNPDDVVLVDSLINEDPEELLERIPPDRDWLLFTVRKRSQNIQPLKLRSSTIQEGEPVYIIGWRYSDKDCPQVVYEGNYVRSEEGSFLITTKELSDNSMPGLSGSPVIDSNGYLLGLMSQKAGKMERPSSLDYPRMLIEKRLKIKE